MTQKGSAAAIERTLFLCDYLRGADELYLGGKAGEERQHGVPSRRIRQMGNALLERVESSHSGKNRGNVAVFNAQ
jgi:hypothetical protein